MSILSSSILSYNINRKNIFQLLLFIGHLIILSSLLYPDLLITKGIEIYKVYHSQWGICILSSFLLVLFFLQPDKKKIEISPADVFLSISFLLVILTYDQEFDPAPIKLLFACQLFMLWILTRLTFLYYPESKEYLLTAVLYTGIYEAGLALCQLYKLTPSLHTIYQLTGTFYNPGPLGGYLAAILPVGLYFILQPFSEKSRLSYLFFHYSGWLAFILILATLPMTMSRSAWIAACIGCVYVYGSCRLKKEWPSCQWRIHNKKISLYSILFLAAIYVSGSFLVNLKKESAQGRSLMWKISTLTILDQPFRTDGLGSFPARYGKTQAAYFESGKASANEKWVAGVSQYAFNEYLHLTIEIGIAGVICLLAWLFTTIFYGISNKRTGATGSIIALLIFAFSSYPLQLPSFWILLIYLSALCVSGTNAGMNNLFAGRKMIACCLLLVIVTSFLLLNRYHTYRKAYLSWDKNRGFYLLTTSTNASLRYQELYPLLHHNSSFLFELAQYENRIGNYTNAICYLTRATRLSNDPMLYYIRAKNRQETGAYELAEQDLIHGINLLPERIYPYYLLTKLYANPNFYQHEKMHIAADSVLTKQPKINSTAIQEMRDEIKSLLEEKKVE